MNHDKLKGWIKSAYPGVTVYPQADWRIFYSDNRRDIQCSLDNGVAKFPGVAGERVFTDEHEIVQYCTMVWGSPKVEFRFSEQQNSSQKPPRRKPTQQKVETHQEPSTKENKEQSQVNVSGLLVKSRDAILGDLKKNYRDVSTKKLSNGSIEVTINGVPGPVLYDYGISPGVGQGGTFVPYAHGDKVREIIEGYLKTV